MMDVNLGYLKLTRNKLCSSGILKEKKLIQCYTRENSLDGASLI